MKGVGTIKRKFKQLQEKYCSYTKRKKTFITAIALTLFFSYLAGAAVGTFTHESRFFIASTIRTISYPLVFILCIFLGTAASVCIQYLFPKKRNGIYDKNRNFTVSDKGTYGTARLQSDRELERILDFYTVAEGERSKDTILGLNAKRDRVILFRPRRYDKYTGIMITDFNPNIALIGSQGSMKTAAFINNYIEKCMRRGESMLIMDTKGDLYHNWGEALKNDGYIVKQWNTKDFRFSDPWDLLSELKFIDMTTFVTAIMVNTGDRQESSKDFYDNADANLLRALFFYFIGKTACGALLN